MVVLVVLLAASTLVSPWPTALVLRHSPVLAGDPGRMEPHVPGGVTTLHDEPYRSGDPDALLDVTTPDDAAGPLPAVVWVHGGAFVAGQRADVAPYLEILAAHGYATVDVGYSLAPGSTYPTQIEQVADAVAHLVAHADRLGIDPDRLVLAGDSAGAHIAAQVALLVADPDYGARVGVPAPADAGPLLGTVLVSGVFDLDVADRATGLGGWLQRQLLWAYTGERDFADDAWLRLASLPQQVGATYPPTFLSTGADDPFLPHAHAMADALEAHGVPVDTFFPPAGDIATPHEYQFDLDQQPGQEALDRVLAFLAAATA